ncbi:MAG: hypothetical protein OM95_10285 [Bdellovibrio sp. ArHS]|uniref:hypothetical protein n=1 Tax=Bdellovibrio sp. ArHS TaxID=1569284 RepID=UPI000583797B|nr:hypothetical protein [Bdellovibrio sp. ArHS]KHD88153.1 MAG: hypothetical protein OM95_10285 [Bdellovibrio sp. ArHS]
MKLLISSILSLIFLGAIPAEAQLRETASEVSFELTHPKEARAIYQYLALPVQWGDKVTGKPHQYKFYADKAGAMNLYCDLVAGNPRCILTLKKILSTDMTEVHNDDQQIQVALFDPQDAEPLFKSLLIKGIEHGGYEIRALMDEAMNFSISCMKDVANYTGTSCQIYIFKGNKI